MCFHSSATNQPTQPTNQPSAYIIYESRSLWYPTPQCLQMWWQGSGARRGGGMIERGDGHTWSKRGHLDRDDDDNGYSAGRRIGGVCRIIVVVLLAWRGEWRFRRAVHCQSRLRKLRGAGRRRLDCCFWETSL